MKREDTLQQSLERLEAGELPEDCRSALADETAALLNLAAQLRALEWPERDQRTMLAQRARLLNLAANQEGNMDRPIKRVFQWLQNWTTGGWRLPVLAGAAIIFLLVIVGGGMFWRASRNQQELVQNITPAPTWQLAAPQKTYVTYLPLASANPPLTPQTARVQPLHGLVEVRTGGEWQPVAISQDIRRGEDVRTGALSGATLSFYDGSQVRIGPNTWLGIELLDAQTTDGARVIVLQQITGETEHTVAASQLPDSHYVVHTPAGSGAAQGTVFQVAVTEAERSRFSVTEGTVAVTGGDTTVLVEAGETTNINYGEPPEKPAFTLVGEGVVSAIGETWIIAGQPFATYTGTLILGEPRVGDWVRVQGRLLANDTRIADVITLLRRAPVNRFSLTGEVEAIGDAEWTITGQTIAISDTTVIDADIVVGDQVRVAGVILDSGALQAESIQRLEAAPGLPFDFTGVIEALGDETWTISGFAIKLDEETEVAPGLAVGDLVRVRGWILEDGVWLAASIAPTLDEASMFEFTGDIVSMDPWNVAGIAFEVREWTLIDDGLAVGDAVRVKGQINADGTWIALEITRLDAEEALRIVFIGVVSSMDPWIVSGIPLPVGDATVIGDVSVGMLARVVIQLSPDGTWQVISIMPLQGSWGFGCFSLTAVVVSIGPDGLLLENWPLLPLDAAVIIPADLQPGSIVQFQVCFGADMTLKIIAIIVITPPDEAAPTPPPAADEKVTICHKASKKNSHTLTISRSALPAHLGHGDTLGACP